MTKPFAGVINVDVRDSIPDWEPFLPPNAPEEAPNVLYIVWDDVGFGAMSPYGGLIETPNMDRIAKMGLRYTQWHTTALCSPTRSCLLTGRNAHSNGMAVIVEAANGFPGLSGVIPPENGTLAEILVEHGYNTYAVGKWHLTPETESNMAGSKRTWPLGRGFERYYGFLGGETNQWYPDLVYDNHFIEQPYSPEEGYHLSEDLTDKAIEFLRDAKQIAPQKPFFLYFTPGCGHAPHHVAQEWIERYRGKFDMGYEKYREIVLERQKQMGIVPEDTELTPINPWPAPDVISAGDAVKPWESLTDDEKRLFARMAEVYAGFVSHTDHHIGRLLDNLEESGELENTIVVVVSDNGASGEGTPDGSVNENKFFNGWPDDLQENLAKLDQLGSVDTYNHFPTGWAWAFNAPYKMFKRYSLEGGIADPCIIAWPKKITDDLGGIRDQYHHAIDIMPTILDLAGIKAPPTLKGYPQSPIAGASMAYSLAAADTPSQRQTQYYAMLGTRAIYHQGWKAVARHGAITGKGNFNADEWELYHTDEDRSEMNDLANQNPEKVQEMISLWFAEAGKYDVFPLDDRTAREQLALDRPGIASPRESYVYYPHTADIPEGVAANIRNRSFTISAEVNIQAPEAEGVIFAHGSRFGGHALFVKEGKLYYSYNFLGIKEQLFKSSVPVPTGEVVLGVEFDKTHEDPKFVANGDLKLYIDDKVVAQGAMRTQPGKFSLSGEGLCIGRESADTVSKEYAPPFKFTGGEIAQVTVNVTGEHYIDLEMEALAMMARE